MNYIIDKFRASIEVEKSNEAIYIYINIKVIYCAMKKAVCWFYLSNLEENALKNNIVTMLES